MASIRCHTVSKFYLDFFLPPGEKCFWVYDKKDVSVRPQTPDNTTVIGDYYLSKPDDCGNKDRRVEDSLAQLEGDTKPILKKWGQPPYQIEQSKISTVASFLAFLYTRVSASVEKVKEIHATGLDYSLDKLKEGLSTLQGHEYFMKSTGSQVSLEEYTELVRGIGFKIDDKYMVGQSLSYAEKIYQYLVDMDWSILCVNGKFFFVTSDNPLTVFSIDQNGRTIFGGGFRLPNVQLTIPLSPKACLFLSRKPIGSSTLPVEEINRRTIFAANQYVISPFQSNRIKKIVKEFSHTFGQPKIDVKSLEEKLKKDLILPEMNFLNRFP